MVLKVKSVLRIDAASWDQLVVSTYGRPYSFAKQNGGKNSGAESFKVPCAVNDIGYEEIEELPFSGMMEVTFKAWLARAPDQPLPRQNEYLKDWWEHNFYPDVQMIAKGL